VSIQPYYEDETTALYCADSLKVLAALPTGSVDALVTDPPYSSGGMVRGDRTATTSGKYVRAEVNTQADFTGDNRDQRGYSYWCALWLSECLRIVKPGGVALLFSDWRQLPSTTDALQSGGFVWRGVVPWYKPVARPTAGRFTAHCEYVVWGSSGAMPLDYSGNTPTFPGFYQAAPPRDREHQTQKPLDVMRELVKIAPEGGTVLDPFMGSGTTGVAAVLEGRKFIGVEMTEHYAEVARERITTAVNGYRPSGDQMILGVD
jgi:site-specific DNA-methyltransferase (adenine-specific)